MDWRAASQGAWYEVSGRVDLKRAGAGFIIVMIAVWGGAWGLHVCPVWAGFPTFISACAVGTFGFIVFTSAISDSY